MSFFSDAAALSQYEETTSRIVPGFKQLQIMTLALLKERTHCEKAKILVVGAGGGLELKVFAESQREWEFEGVDPSAEMLAMARERLGTLIERVKLHEGYIDTASEELFDGATSLLTMHFIEAEERLKTLTEIHRRLKPGAPLVLVHHSFPQNDAEKKKWLSRYAAFAALSGVNEEKALAGAEAIGKRLPILSPSDDEALLLRVGFKDISIFYAAFTFRGWVAYR